MVLVQVLVKEEVVGLHPLVQFVHSLSPAQIKHRIIHVKMLELTVGLGQDI